VPFWFRFHPDKRQIESHDVVSGFASMHYRLPADGEMLKPASLSIA
jgi:hypothetical protein